MSGAYEMVDRSAEMASPISDGREDPDDVGGGGGDDDDDDDDEEPVFRNVVLDAAASSGGNVRLGQLLALEEMSTAEKYGCVVCSSLLLLTIVLCLLGLVVGMGRITWALSDQQDRARFGLRLVNGPPRVTIADFPITLLAPETHRAIAQRVKNMSEYLEAYMSEQTSRERWLSRCTSTSKPDTRFCRFDFPKSMGKHCNVTDNFGYDAAEPCILFALHLDEKRWQPRKAEKAAIEDGYLAIRCEATTIATYQSTANVTFLYFPEHPTKRGFGAFPTNKLPQRSIKTTDGTQVTESSNDTKALIDQPPLLMVKILGRERLHPLVVDCALEEPLLRKSSTRRRVKTLFPPAAMMPLDLN